MLKVRLEIISFFFKVLNLNVKLENTSVADAHQRCHAYTAVPWDSPIFPNIGLLFI